MQLSIKTNSQICVMIGSTWKPFPLFPLSVAELAPGSARNQSVGDPESAFLELRENTC